jgi:hypothetical protein
VELGSEDAKNAGILHAAVKKVKPNFSLADAVVLQLARREKARAHGGPRLSGHRRSRDDREVTLGFYPRNVLQYVSCTMPN